MLKKFFGIRKIYSVVFIVFFLFYKTISSIDAVGNLLEPWEPQTPLPYTNASHKIGVYGDSVYILGGAGQENASDVGHNEILRSRIGIDGNIGVWEELPTTLPQKLIWHNSVFNDRYVYVLGGVNVNNLNNLYTIPNVYKGTLTTDGSDILWENISPLPQSLSNGGAFIKNGFLYYLGGYRIFGDTSIVNANMYRSPINADGSIGLWQTVSSLPLPLAEFSMFLNGNKLILLGGTNTTTLIPQNQVHYSEILENGDISSWTNLNPFILPIRRPNFEFYNDYFIVTGGIISNILPYSNQTYYSKANEFGLPSNWEVSGELLPDTNCCGAMIAHDDALYLFGGHGFNGNSFSYFSTVIKSKLKLTNSQFELPFAYEGRGENDEEAFVNAFWDRRTALFDHNPAKESFVNFLGDTYLPIDCDTNIDACYDSHNGVDFDDIPGTSDKAMSVANGQVVYVSDRTPNDKHCIPEKSGYGCVAIVKYETEDFGDIYGLYAHLKEIYVEADENVTYESELGLMGNTGNVTGPHLHFSTMTQLANFGVNSLKKMSKNNWRELVANVANNSSSDVTKGKKSSCTYKVDVFTFAFNDPSGWYGEGVDPYSLPITEGGCGYTNNLLWKYDTSIN